MNSSPAQREIVVYTDFICPWCYIGMAYLRRALERIPFRTKYVMFPLHPNTPPGGISLYKLFGGQKEDIDRRQFEIREHALGLGLKYKSRTHSYNSRNAQIIGKGLLKSGNFDVFQESVFNAYFGAGKDIGCLDVLQALLDDISPNRWSADRLCNDPELKACVQHDWQTAKAHGVYSVPSYHLGDRYCIGTQTSTKLIELLQDYSPENAL